MGKAYIGIDNGVTGSIGVIYSDGTYDMVPTPIIKQQDYTKKVKVIARLDSILFKKLLEEYKKQAELFIVLERPMVNPKMFRATASALRCHEATLVIIENFNIPYMFMDSKEWQKKMLPKGIIGKGDKLGLKKASLDIALRKYTKTSNLLKKQKDGDALLIAEYAKIMGF